MNQTTVIRLDSTEEVISFLRSEEVEESLEGIWVKDRDALHSLDPQVVDWIVTGLRVTLPWLIPWLVNQAQKAEAPISVEAPLETTKPLKIYVTLEISPDMSDEDIAAAVQRMIKAIEERS
jgi:hypothetical protein